jgi:hypothetical protein
MATTTPNFGWPVPTSTDLVKDGATAIEALGDGIDTSMVDLKGGLTGQVLAKATNADMDFSWVTTDDTNAIQNAIVDAKGDLIGATAADTPARLAVGTNGQVLTADSTASTGLAWATPSAGGMTLLSTTTLSGASTTISSISQSYTNLLVQIYGMTNDTANGVFTVKLNNISSIYATSIQDTTLSRLSNATLTSGANGVRTNNQNAYTLLINNYTNPTTTTFCPISFYGTNLDSGGTFYPSTVINGGFAGTSAVTSLVFSNSGGNFSGGTVLVYGVK